jgi:hypothetical protein
MMDILVSAQYDLWQGLLPEDLCMSLQKFNNVATLLVRSNCATRVAPSGCRDRITARDTESIAYIIVNALMMTKLTTTMTTLREEDDLTTMESQRQA